MSNTEILQTILSKIERIEKTLTNQDERRVGTREFADRLNFSEPTLWDRINKGLIAPPFKDGRLNYWLNSYVNEVIADNLNFKNNGKVK